MSTLNLILFLICLAVGLYLLDLWVKMNDRVKSTLYVVIGVVVVVVVLKWLWVFLDLGTVAP